MSTTEAERFAAIEDAIDTYDRDVDIICRKYPRLDDTSNQARLELILAAQHQLWDALDTNIGEGNITIDGIVLPRSTSVQGCPGDRRTDDVFLLVRRNGLIEYRRIGNRNVYWAGRSAQDARDMLNDPRHQHARHPR